MSDGTIYAFFSYRNLPPGSKIGVRILWGTDTTSEFEVIPTSANRQGARLVVISYGSPSGGARAPWGSSVGVVLSLVAAEIVRGSVQ